MLFEVLDRLRQQTIISSIVMMMLGLLMLIIPTEYDYTLVNVLGYAIIILGAVMVWGFIGGPKHLSNCILFIFALLAILLGIYILVSGNDILRALSVLFGTLLMVDGVHSIVYAWIYARRSGKKWWGLLLLLSFLLFLSGLVIFNNPWWSRPHSFVKVIGGVIRFSAALGIIRLILVWPVRKDRGED